MKTFAFVSIVVACSSAAVGQRLVTYDPLLNNLPQVVAPSPIWGGGGLGYGAPAAPTPLPPVLAPAGDVTVDSATGHVWYTNGYAVAAAQIADLAPVPLPPLAPIPMTLIAILGGPVTGMARDPDAGILWLTAGTSVVGVSSSWAVVAGPFLPMTISSLTGLDWDAIGGTLVACDGFGVVYRFLPSGAPFGSPIFPAAVPAGLVVGVAIDKAGLVNAAGQRSIYVTNGASMTEVYTGAATGLRGSALTASGIAFLPVPVSRPLGPCPCDISGPTWSFGGTCAAGNASFSLRLGGLAPGSPALFLLGFAFDPLFPYINGNGCGLGLIAGPGVATSLAFSDGSGTATYSLALLAPPGLTLYAQAGTACANDPFGFILTSTVQVPLCGN